MDVQTAQDLLRTWMTCNGDNHWERLRDAMGTVLAALATERQQREQEKQMDAVVIVVNGTKFGIDLLPGQTLSYRDVVGFAKLDGTPSMTMKRKGYEGIIVHPGDALTLSVGMVFNVAHTDNA